MDRRQMRAGDAERQHVAEQLRTALELGRLDLHEYDERVQRTYAAKTFGDLDGLLDDLPDTVPPTAGAQLMVPSGNDGLVAGPDGRFPNATARWLAHTWDGYFATVAIVVAIWAVICLMTAEWLYFWPAWVAGPWGAVLLVSTIGGLASGEPQKWAAEKAREQQRKRAKEDAEGDED
ncbi:DUF1707 domain-containing protein [Asanoa sp. WMMD1127]|uniref:DUF1707 SHOCT-like domain-containing protein n=1 Tax=Asanoa sp. WMMD1127 TaxID=3016107 RepID=UPI002417976C|nr:DUF1707 domain-containing protein [Asanoa sp. WMMD1127]MDG4821187.1 DUF1707 domain-containing protein [Asanoa sp. WMMD1127]